MIAFSTAPRCAASPARRASHDRRDRRTTRCPALFQGVVEATEEAIYNSLFMATTMSAKGGTVEAIPVAEVRRILDRHGMLKR